MTPRIALVTGGIGGLGTAICRALTEAGHTVIATDLPADPARLEAFQAATDGRVAFEPADVGDDAQCAQLIARVQAAHGALDILVNNAGITRDATLRKMDLAQWNAVLQVNLTSAFQLCHHAIAGMVERGHGRIVNISSVSGQTGNFGQANYAAAKAGLHGLTMSLAREVASKGVTVNSVSPGYVRTPMTAAMPAEVLQRTTGLVPVGRLGEPEDIARAVRFLAEDAAGYITGANLPVNGGLYMGF
ncbi:acetoacetyl-CoA reductase [Pseudoxanthomonas winnipegensis]|jgi:acetoacetyl-CoA reductase|uniref:Acetoacetyl-CoA reductase n=1 Tax=Pseudoxanthomonas winnipegensis TaxID=2480810 RepID=A0ABY1WFR8_9GAMM|nr:acetoacetyl-CoA reductase [Pseudoxanthomonas winnipegensis]TAA07118.1 acetoacetyl-CoA reductase [Pseudoxanthomonas winnipegensis]TAA20759.1 acetoacetyl-CoA reductase [Pseudoxanthomonas winnipegensis]TAH72229.1 acetoacetyl-CoA reductase [Pseudoxanthomonas winnipegensis]